MKKRVFILSFLGLLMLATAVATAADNNHDNPSQKTGFCSLS